MLIFHHSQNTRANQQLRLVGKSWFHRMLQLDYVETL